MSREHWVEKLIRVCFSDTPAWARSAALGEFRDFVHGQKMDTLQHIAVRARIEHKMKSPEMRRAVLNIIAECEDDEMNIFDAAFVFRNQPDLMHDCFQKCIAATASIVSADHVFGLILDEEKKTFRVVLRNAVIVEGPTDVSDMWAMRFLQIAWSNSFLRFRINSTNSQSTEKSRTAQMRDFIVRLKKTPCLTPAPSSKMYHKREFNFRGDRGSMTYFTYNSIDSPATLEDEIHLDPELAIVFR